MLRQDVDIGEIGQRDFVGDDSRESYQGPRAIAALFRVQAEADGRVDHDLELLDGEPHGPIQLVRVEGFVEVLEGNEACIGADEAAIPGPTSCLGGGQRHGARVNLCCCCCCLDNRIGLCVEGGDEMSCASTWEAAAAAQGSRYPAYFAFIPNDRPAPMPRIRQLSHTVTHTCCGCQMQYSFFFPFPPGGA